MRPAFLVMLVAAATGCSGPGAGDGSSAQVGVEGGATLPDGSLDGTVEATADAGAALDAPKSSDALSSADVDAGQALGFTIQKSQLNLVAGEHAALERETGRLEDALVAFCNEEVS